MKLLYESLHAWILAFKQQIVSVNVSQRYLPFAPIGIAFVDVEFCLGTLSMASETSVVLTPGTYVPAGASVVFNTISCLFGEVVLSFDVVVLLTLAAGDSVVCNNPCTLVALLAGAAVGFSVVFSVVLSGFDVVLTGL